MKNTTMTAMLVALCAISGLSAYHGYRDGYYGDERYYRDGVVVGTADDVARGTGRVVRGTGRVARDTARTGLNILTLGGVSRAEDAQRDEEAARDYR